MPQLRTRLGTILGLVAVSCLSGIGIRASGETSDTRVRNTVDAAVRSIMDEHGVPGMAVAVTAGGRRFVFDYGVTAPGGDRAVTKDTLFEIGSISKTYTATLAAYAEATGRLSFSDKASRYLPELEGSAIGNASLDELGTYTAGGLPLQFPDTVTDRDSMLAFYRDWTPPYPAGTRRLYSNASIGLFGHLAAKSLGGDLPALMQDTMLPALGLSSTFVRVPADRMADYAWGMTKDGRKARMTPGVLDAEAYGIKTTASDLLRFVEAAMNADGLGADWQRALKTPQEPRYGIGAMMQGFGWESYAYPAALDDLLAGNSADVATKANPVQPLPPRPSAFLVNKTGSTDGFGAYAAFVPSRRIGVVILANRPYPNAARIKAAYAILSALD